MTSEESVLQHLAAGDLRTAAEVAIRGLGPDVLRYLRASLRDEADAADAFSLFAEKLWRGLPSFRGESSLRTWSFRLAVNVVANLRNEAWRRRVRRLHTSEASAIAEQVRTSSAARVEHRLQGLQKLRLTLSNPDQSLLNLRIDQKFSWKEIAEVLSDGGRRTSAAALCKRFERLKQRLARMAKAQGILESSSHDLRSRRRGRTTVKK